MLAFAAMYASQTKYAEPGIAVPPRSSFKWFSLLLLGLLGAAYLIAARMPVNLEIDFSASEPGALQIFWDSGNGFNESQSRTLSTSPGRKTYSVDLSGLTVYRLRLDPCACVKPVTIHSIRAGRLLPIKRWDAAGGLSEWMPKNDIASVRFESDGLLIQPSAADPFFVFEGWSGVRRALAMQAYGLYALAAALAIVFFLLIFGRDQARVLAGPLIGLAALLVFGALAAAIFRFAAGRNLTPALPSFNTAEGLYDLSLVAANGEYLSEKRGKLKLMFDPFLGYRNLPGQNTSAYSIDSHGFRGGVDNDKPKKVVVLGSSAAFGQGLGSDEQTFSAQLEKRLNGLDVINAAVVGYLSGQELAMMLHGFDDFDVKNFIVFDGWNELFVQAYSPWPRSKDQYGFNDSFFEVQMKLRELTLIRTNEGGIMSELRPSGPPSEDREAEVLDRISSTYISNLKKMNVLAAARGAKLLIVFQPELGQKLSRTPAENEMLKGWDQRFNYLKRNFPEKYRNLIARVSNELQTANISFINLADAPEFVSGSEELFLDVVHLNPAGHAAVAQKLSQNPR